MPRLLNQTGHETVVESEDPFVPMAGWFAMDDRTPRIMFCAQFQGRFNPGVSMHSLKNDSISILSNGSAPHRQFRVVVFLMQRLSAPLLYE